MSRAVRENVAIIIPVYNEARVIGTVLKRVLKQFKYVVCVDDGSTDNSFSEVAKTKAYVIEHPINMGQGAALQTGLEFARQLPVDYFVTFDADGQHRVEDVETMIAEIEADDCDIILGSRFMGEIIGMSNMRRAVLKAAVRFSNATSGLVLTDAHNGLRIFNRVVAEGMQITLPDMGHASEIPEIIAKKQFRYKEMPVTIEYTDYSKAKGQSILNAVNIGFDTLLRKVTR